jgi:hypothetical protein
MIDFSLVRFPVLLNPEQAKRLVELLLDAKTSAAAIQRDQPGSNIFDLARASLRILDQELMLDPRDKPREEQAVRGGEQKVIPLRKPL